MKNIGSKEIINSGSHSGSEQAINKAVKLQSVDTIADMEYQQP